MILMKKSRSWTFDMILHENYATWWKMHNGKLCHSGGSELLTKKVKKSNNIDTNEEI